MSRRSFLLGAVPSALVTVGIFTLLGFVLGVPAERYLRQVDAVALDGGVLVVLGLVSYLALRHIPPGDRQENPLGLPRRGARLVAGLGVDLAILSGSVVGLFELLDELLHRQPDGPLDSAAVSAAVLVGYVLLARRAAAGTAGERLMSVSYRRSVRRGEHADGLSAS